MKNPINGEKLIDDFEENSAKARLMYPGRIFVSGFSDGVKEVTGSEGTNFYLQLKGTKDLFDLDYVYIELKDNNGFAGGGGSFNNGSNQSNTGALWEDHGKCTITKQ